MKKTYQLLAVIALSFAFASCEQKKIVSVEDLPESAQTYIQENYADAKVLFVKKEGNFFNAKYKVQFDNRIELEFKKDGSLIDIDIED